MKISGKHSVEELNGVRCSVVEKQASEERAKFLQTLLENNGYRVMMQKNTPPPPKPQKPGVEAPNLGVSTPPTPPAGPETFSVGVTDLSFNVAIMVYSRKLKTLQHKVLLPTYWTQEAPEYEGCYFDFKK